MYLQNMMQSKSLLKTRSLLSGLPAFMLTQSQRSHHSKVLVDSGIVVAEQIIALGYKPINS